MRKNFLKPEIEIKRFMKENIVTTSAMYGEKISDNDVSNYTTGSISIKEFTQNINFVW